MIYFIERNVHGTWVVYGALGVKQYYGYTKKQAKQMYLNECNATIITNKEATK